jgi:hypothetical protein
MAKEVAARSREENDEARMTELEGMTNVEVGLFHHYCFVISHSDFDIVLAPGVTRTPDPRIRNPLLYPAELRAQK